MRLSDEIVGKMEKFIKRIADQYTYADGGQKISDAAADIMSEIRHELEPDLEAAQRIYSSNMHNTSEIDMILLGIKLGRALEADR